MAKNKTRKISFPRQTWEEQLKIVLEAMKLMPTLVTKADIAKHLKELGYEGKDLNTYVSRAVDRLVHIGDLKKHEGETMCSRCGHGLLKRPYYRLKEAPEPMKVSSPAKTYGKITNKRPPPL